MSIEEKVNLITAKLEGDKDGFTTRITKYGNVMISFKTREQKNIFIRKEWNTSDGTYIVGPRPLPIIVMNDVPCELLDNDDFWKKSEITKKSVKRFALFKSPPTQGLKIKVAIQLDSWKYHDLLLTHGFVNIDGRKFFVSAFKTHNKYRQKPCFNCQQDGHIAKDCQNTPKCGFCAGGHNSRSCNNSKEAGQIVSLLC